MVNKVQVLDPPHAIALTGQEKGDGHLEFGGWIWRYDRDPLGPSETNSLHHMAELAAPTSRAGDTRRPDTGG